MSRKKFQSYPLPESYRRGEYATYELPEGFQVGPVIRWVDVYARSDVVRVEWCWDEHEKWDGSLGLSLFARQLLLREWGRLMELAPQPWKDKKGEMIKFVLDLDEPTRGVLDILPQFYCEFQLFFQGIAHRSMAFEWFSTEEISAD